MEMGLLTVALRGCLITGFSNMCHVPIHLLFSSVIVPLLENLCTEYLSSMRIDVLVQVGKTLRVGGWVKTGREAGAGAFAFLQINDGSCFDSIQVCIQLLDSYVNPISLRLPARSFDSSQQHVLKHSISC
jgi:hypothetical protein